MGPILAKSDNLDVFSDRSESTNLRFQMRGLAAMNRNAFIVIATPDTQKISQASIAGVLRLDKWRVLLTMQLRHRAPPISKGPCIDLLSEETSIKS